MREGKDRLQENAAIDVTYDIAVIVRAAILDRLFPVKLIQHISHYNSIGASMRDVLPASVMEELDERSG